VPSLAGKRIGITVIGTDHHWDIKAYQAQIAEVKRLPGVPFTLADRYAVTDEFLTIWRRLMTGESVSFEGRHLRIDAGKLLYPPVQQPCPPLYVGGSSEAGHAVAAEHVDVYLTWGEPPAAVAEKLALAKAAAAGTPRADGVACSVRSPSRRAH
jgi:alkanesulfonate monooxygenase SsuD/methylene tetrahydromethanopterin reductase-like flavin-dependent oxidoreductase (luciferase family)